MTVTGDTLVADIGGTNTRVALAHGLTVRTETVRRYANTERLADGWRFPDIERVLHTYIEETGCPAPDAVCVAAAGPVEEEAVTMTNIEHWPRIDRDALRRATGARVVAILNDLQAQGHALGHIQAEKVRTIIPFPQASPHAAKLVIGVGTGFNAAPVFETGAGRLVPPSESGHVNLPARAEEDWRLCAWIERQAEPFDFPSVEEALSGRGVEHVHAWLCEEAGVPAGRSATEIMTAAGAGDELAQRTKRVVTRLLGVVAGNLALANLPFGGIWLIGGVARALAPTLIADGFVEAFRDKGRFAPLMERFGVGVIEDDYAALIGSAAHLQGLLQREGA
jgi:glucokinase